MYGNSSPLQPTNPELMDVNGSGGIDITDLIYLVDYMFNGGPDPVNPWP